MGRLLPFETETKARPGDPQVLDLDDEATAEALSALSSETAREILATLYDEPQTPPDVRDNVGTSLQNVHYHIERLEGADLIQPAGSGYSEKGTEMTVYAPKSEAVVLFAGQQHHRSRLKTALTRLLGAVGVLGLATLALERLFGNRAGFRSGSGVSDGGGAGGDAGGAPSTLEAEEAGSGATPSASPTPEPSPTVADGGTDAAQSGGDGGGDGGVGIMAEETETATPHPTSEPTGTPTPEPTVEPSSTSESAPTLVADASETQAGVTKTPSPTPEAMSEPTTTPISTELADGAADLAGSAGQGLDPALAFFLGGVFMLGLVVIWWSWQGR